MDDYSGSGDVTSDEASLFERVRRGEILDLGGRTIHAAVLRDLLLRHRGADIPLTGLRIKNACVDGPLDLADLARPCMGLPALLLEFCNLPHLINLEGSRFARLSIKGSRFRFLNMRESEIDGPFDFSGAKPYYDDRPPEAWIDACGCIVNGQITGSGAHLLAPEARPAEDVKVGDRRYALWLANADVRGSIILLDSFVADGGVCLRSARVRGDIWASGARLPRARVSPSMHRQRGLATLWPLNNGFIAEGKIWLLATHIDARLLLDGARLLGTDNKDKPEPHKDRKALHADNIQVGAAVSMGEEFTAEGEVSLCGATIHGSFRCQNSVFNNATSDGQGKAFVAIGAQFNDEVQFDGATVNGRMNLNGVQIRGRLSFNGATITNTTADGKAVVALSAVGARIAGTLRFARFGPTTTTEPGGARLHCEGRINLAGAEVGGDLLFQGASLRNGTEDAIALSAKGIHVGGNVSFTSGSSAEGAVMMPGATVGRGVRFSEARFRNRAETAIHAKDMRIGDDLCFENTAAEGDLRFERIDVAGSLVWDGLAISSTRKQKPNPPLDLRHARIGSALKARELSVEHPSLIDLYGMRVSSIELSWPKGWGSPKADHRARLVNLDGLTYDRITISSAREKASASLLVRLGDLLARVFGPRRNSLANDYARWLRLQAKQTAGDGSGFLPQPYRQLARVLRNQGEDGAARDIAIAEQWAAPKAGLLPGMARSAFGIGFGFGLRPRNAIITLLVFLLVGTGGVWTAKDRGLLKETMVVASTEAKVLPRERKDDPQPRRLIPAMVRVDGSASDPDNEVDCTDAANTLKDDFVYAADMLVPFIPLHQEAKCEIAPGTGQGQDWWRLLKAAYSVTGWIIFSLALVTFSGMLKRFDRDAA